MELRIPANSKAQTIREVPASVFINKMAQHIKASGQFDVPAWMKYAKTSCAKELSPYEEDFIFVRAASILRHLSFRADAGVGRFQKIYGSTQNSGVAPSHHRDASGKLIRHCIQQLEKMQLLAQRENKGSRILTARGRSACDSIAKQCL